jgi:hypothetical protein
MKIIELSVSKDGGYNFGPWRQRSLGSVGTFIKRIEWLQLGRASEWIIRVRVSAPIKRDLLDAAWLPEATNR